ncbi:flagellar motor switch protein FliG [Alicyclobacillus fastidiosus]|uniref:Flagellar motor switch protein FliG n=1 Tax=Alicyclobacillus fastidiosus TaxID=392011 RepID=A0ABY6ZBU9_9BACL|nr:flagellar motor switch protein FliG [Alicyclobacillus fastidiosus]WAH40210.1 flagellar motor switch protein FliG [Alicyclobacillus fastidiosus]GMA61568.1 flagellar motor switch protein FliG [Alicyclobacillus fastidiosus]
MVQRQQTLSGRQKAAVLLIALGQDVAASVFKRLSHEEVEQLTFEIANVSKVNFEQREHILEEFRDLAMAREYIQTGGIQYARDVLEKALGGKEAEDILNRLTSALQVRPFHFARKADPNQVLGFIQDEHPQTVALVLSYLDADQAAMIISALPADLQADVARRIATMKGTSPDVIAEVEDILESKLSTMTTVDSAQAGGIEAIVKILNGVDRSTEKGILEKLSTKDPDLVDEIKKRMFVFEDIIFLDGKAIQRVIREVDARDLQLALKVSRDDVKEVLFNNMSKRMAETFQEDMEYMGPVRLRDVEDAQQRIVGVIRHLEDLGEIVVSHGGGDDIIV